MKIGALLREKVAVPATEVWAALAVLAAMAPAFAYRHRAGIVSVLAVAIFYLPALSVGSNLVMGGDTLGWYMPALAKTHALIGSLDFTAIDFSSFNGSSDFFLSPNFFAYHPLVVVFALLTPAAAASVDGLAKFITLALALHSFLALYFSIRLFTRFFGFEFGAAVLIGVLFAFSPYMLNSRYAPPFFFCATIVPWAAYAALSYAALPETRRLVIGALPVIFGFMAGYLPLGVACLGLAAVIVAVQIAVHEDGGLGQVTARVLLAVRPFVLAAGVVLLYAWAVYSFHKETSSFSVPSLFYSAHQLGELPQSVLRVFSSHYSVPGPYYEFSLVWGFIAIAIAALFVLTPRASLSLTPKEWLVLKAAAVVYFATVLAIFGQHSAASDLVYYFVPQVGKMHIYQRFLLPSNLMFALLVALMLKGLLDQRPPVAIRIAVGVLAVVTATVAYIVAFEAATAQKLGFNNYLVFELGLALLFAVALTFPGRQFIYAAAAVLVSLPMLDRMYDGSLADTVLDSQRKGRVSIDPELRSRFVGWVKGRFPDRDIIKYVDVTPMWSKDGSETFPKVFPFFALQEVPLSSYGGFTFYLSARGEYMKRMPVGLDVRVLPDWDYVRKSGADFVVTLAQDLHPGSPLTALVANLAPGDRFALPNNVVAVPLRPPRPDRASADGRLYENGFFRVYPSGSKLDPARGQNLALRKPAKQSGDGGGAASLAVDGNTDGDFKAGSVTHSTRDMHAWLEVDLESSQQIDAVAIWNRTDAGMHRLRNYWVFISETPFAPTDRVEALRSRAGTWSKTSFTPTPSAVLETGGVQGRYVRIQFDGTTVPEESYLTIAEIQVLRYDPRDVARVAKGPAGTVKVRDFATDYAQWVDLELESSAPATVEYLLSPNPRLRFFVDGKSVEPAQKAGLTTFEVGAGAHTVEVRYRHWWLKLFWIVYGLYGLALVASFLSFVRERPAVRKLERRILSR
jgi:hypothetical protein